MSGAGPEPSAVASDGIQRSSAFIVYAVPPDHSKTARKGVLDDREEFYPGKWG
jgi:hypothetical protein